MPFSARFVLQIDVKKIVVNCIESAHKTTKSNTNITKSTSRFTSNMDLPQNQFSDSFESKLRVIFQRN